MDIRYQNDIKLVLGHSPPSSASSSKKRKRSPTAVEKYEIGVRYCEDHGAEVNRSFHSCIENKPFSFLHSQEEVAKEGKLSTVVEAELSAEVNQTA